MKGYSAMSTKRIVPTLLRSMDASRAFYGFSRLNLAMDMGWTRRSSAGESQGVP
jgi:hypothetical protein